MADWSVPVTTTLYTGVLSALDDRLDELAKMFNGASPTNLPTGAFRIDGSSNNLLQTWNGASWDNEGLAVQTLRIGQDAANASGTVTDLFLGTDANIAAEGHLSFFIDSDNNSSSAQFKWYNNAAAVTGANLLMSLSEAGLLTLEGQMNINSGGATNAFKLNANTGFDTRLEFRENNVIRAYEFYDESDDSFRIIKVASNGTTVQAELRLRNSGFIDVLTGQFRLTQDYGASVSAFDIEDTVTNARLRFYPDLAVAAINPKSQVDDFGMFFSDSAINLAKGIIGVWGGAGAPAIRFDAVAQTMEFVANSGHLFTDGNVVISDELRTTAVSETYASYSIASGTKILNMALSTYFYPAAAMTAVAYTFQFDNPATSRVTSFVLELNSAGTATGITWPASVDWVGGSPPDFTAAGIDVLTFLTRDAGTTWLGFVGGLDIK